MSMTLQQLQNSYPDPFNQIITTKILRARDNISQEEYYWKVKEIITTCVLNIIRGGDELANQIILSTRLIHALSNDAKINPPKIQVEIGGLNIILEGALQ
jgi:hypothetical protein